MQPNDLARALDDCLCAAETALMAGAGIAHAHETLDALAALVRADKATAAQSDYERFLQRLTQLYADGCRQRDNIACMGTAAAYSGVIEAVSRKQPAFDFTDAFGQLLELMTRLFSAQEKDWKVIYKHLRSVPDAINAKQALERVCSADIHEWFDAGVQNLFSLRNDLTEKIVELGQQAAEIEEEIQLIQGTLGETRHRLDPQGSGKILSFEARFLQREIAHLQGERDALRAERENKEDTRALIESDIREFEGLLREAHRAYYLHLV